MRLQEDTSIATVDLPERVVECLERMFGRQAARLALHEPHFRGAEWTYVKQCLDSGWVSSVGSFVDRFESAFAELSGVPHAVAVVNGTAALQIALIVSGVEQGDEVLIPSLTFVATAAAVRHCGAVRISSTAKSGRWGLIRCRSRNASRRSVRRRAASYEIA